MLHAIWVFIAASIATPATPAPIHFDERKNIDPLEFKTHSPGSNITILVDGRPVNISGARFTPVSSSAVSATSLAGGPSSFIARMGAIPTPPPVGTIRSLEDRGIFKNGFNEPKHFADTKAKSILNVPTRGPATRFKSPMAVPTSLPQDTGSIDSGGQDTTDQGMSLRSGMKASFRGTGPIDREGGDTSSLEQAGGDTGSVDQTDGDETTSEPLSTGSLSGQGADVTAGLPSSSRARGVGAKGSLQGRILHIPIDPLLATRINPPVAVRSSSIPGSQKSSSSAVSATPTVSASAAPSLDPDDLDAVLKDVFSQHTPDRIGVINTTLTHQLSQTSRTNRVARGRLRSRRASEVLAESLSARQDIFDDLFDGIFNIGTKVVGKAGGQAVKDAAQAAEKAGKQGAKALNNTLSSLASASLSDGASPSSPKTPSSSLSKGTPASPSKSPSSSLSEESQPGDDGNGSGGSDNPRRAFEELEARSPRFGSVLTKFLPDVIQEVPEIAQTVKGVVAGASDSSGDSSSTASPTDGPSSARRRSEH